MRGESSYSRGLGTSVCNGGTLAATLQGGSVVLTDVAGKPENCFQPTSRIERRRPTIDTMLMLKCFRNNTAEFEKGALLGGGVIFLSIS